MNILFYFPGDQKIADQLKSRLETPYHQVYDAWQRGHRTVDALQMLLSRHDVLITCAGHGYGQNYRDCVNSVRKMREYSATPIIVYTDSDSMEEAQLIVAGVDYCVGDRDLAFDRSAHLLRVVMERLTRKQEQPELQPDEIRVGGLVLNTNTFCLWETREKKEINLTRIESQMLALLMRRPDFIFTRDQLLDAAYGVDSIMDDRTVDSHMKRVRIKLKKFSAEAPSCLMTVYGAGYGFSARVATTVFPVSNTSSQTLAKVG